MLSLRRRRRTRAEKGLPDATYVELVRSLFMTLPPTIIMVVSFLCVGAAAAVKLNDGPTNVLAALGALCGFARIAIVAGLRGKAAEQDLTAEAAQRIERVFAASYLSFAIVFGIFVARVIDVAPDDTRIPIVTLLVGYGAGVAASVSLRPWIALLSILTATLPATVLALIDPELMVRLAGGVLALLVVGAMNSMLSRWRAAVGQTKMSQLYASLAKHDELTGLANRLLLRERFDAWTESTPSAKLAVHCLDLDKFKPVNDRHGHPAGDMLLKLVAKRLDGLLRQDDLAARVGGDEFIVLQDIAIEGEAETLAHRIVRELSKPYTFDGLTISIGTSVGYAIRPRDSKDLEDLIEQADSALYRAKLRGGGVSPYDLIEGVVKESISPQVGLAKLPA